MTDKKLNTGQEENPQPSLFDAGPEGAPAQDAPALEPPVKENAPGRPLWNRLRRMVRPREGGGYEIIKRVYSRVCFKTVKTPS